jgi:hypothetical protein
MAILTEEEKDFSKKIEDAFAKNRELSFRERQDKVFEVTIALIANSPQSRFESLVKDANKIVSDIYNPQ